MTDKTNTYNLSGDYEITVKKRYFGGVVQMIATALMFFYFGSTAEDLQDPVFGVSILIGSWFTGLWVAAWIVQSLESVMSRLFGEVSNA